MMLFSIGVCIYISDLFIFFQHLIMFTSEFLCQRMSSLHGIIVSRFFCPPRALTKMPLLTKNPMFRAVIFDKDGTLICFNTMWNSWAKVLTKKYAIVPHCTGFARLTDTFGKKLESPIYNLLGVCAKTSTVLPGNCVQSLTI